MRKYYSLLMCVVLPAMSAIAQVPSTWNYGIAVHYSFEKYNITSGSSFIDKPNYTYVTSAKPVFALGTGVWGEKMLNNRISLYSRLDYHTVRMDDEFLSGWYIKVGGGGPYQEWHHSLALSLHGRYYFPTKSKLKIHLDAGFKGDRIVIFRNRYANFDFREWNPKYYNAVVPAYVGGLGLQYGRIGVSLEYQHYVWNDALTKKMAGSESLSFYHREISRKNFTLHTTFRLNRATK